MVINESCTPTGSKLRDMQLLNRLGNLRVHAPIMRYKPIIRDTVSVQEVIDFGKQKGLFNACSCGHMRMSHINMDLLKNKKVTTLEAAMIKCSEKGCNCNGFIYASEETEFQ